MRFSARLCCCRLAQGACPPPAFCADAVSVQRHGAGLRANVGPCAYAFGIWASGGFNGFDSERMMTRMLLARVPRNSSRLYFGGRFGISHTFERTVSERQDCQPDSCGNKNNLKDWWQCTSRNSKTPGTNFPTWGTTGGPGKKLAPLPLASTHCVSGGAFLRYQKSLYEKWLFHLSGFDLRLVPN